MILLKLSCKTHDEILNRLIQELYSNGQKISLPEDTVRKAIMNRETLQGTLLPTGLSIPHARLEALEDPVIVIGVPESPITTRADTPIRMMMLMLTPRTASSLYLNMLAALGKISKGELFPKMCCANDTGVFIKIIEEADIDISKELSVASIMNTTLKVLRPENTVREAIDMFHHECLGYVPIMDDNNLFVGELTMTDLFSICIPDYALKMKNLKFLTHFEPLEDLLRNENSIRVVDVMKKPSLTLDEDSPVVEAVLKFVQSRRRYLPVVKKDTHLIGVVGYKDVLKKVLRA
ncbi:MAG: hypothetical protein Ta2F_01970 [Termitinemataceae bacterium]|nr:MAG: hypothetical protein Ta2F_01970 [Termitinemataceae bacterium]